MASLSENSLRLRLDKRKGTMSEVDAQNYEKQQSECITKAIKNEEVPAKEKHVRRAIIGTWQERGNSMFWSVLGKQPLPSQAFMCWKALTVMHKILREGHPNVLKDSYVYRKTLRDLFSVYRFQAGMYGPIICEYLKILQTKLEMHHKYPGLPGSLTFTEENPIKIPERDINDIFTFAVESLDYQDLLLSLEENLFKTLDKSKNSSQIASFQCRIAALVPLLKECSGMYDVLVHVLTKLHKNLPPDSLDGHRDRFNGQHGRLKTFCFEASALQYITNLTGIPNIPDQPPNFLLHKYEPRREKPRKEEPKPVPITPQIDERDILIEQLMREIEELRQQLAYTENKAKEMENGLRMQIMKLQEELDRLQQAARQAQEESAFLKEQLESAPKEDLNAQEKAKSADEKFNKLKVLYGKLRQDHIDLLRKNGETKLKQEEAEKSSEELQQKLDEASELLLQKERDLQEAGDKMKDLESVNQKLKIDFDQTDESSKGEILKLLEEMEALKRSLSDSKSNSKELQDELEKIRKESEEQIRALSQQMEDIMTGKITEETARKSAEDTINKLRNDHDEMLARLNEEVAKLKQERDELHTARTGTQEALDKLQANSSSELSKLSSDMQQLQLAKQSLMSEKDKLQQELQQKDSLYTSETTALRGDVDRMKEEQLKAKLELLSSTAKECEQIIQDTLQLFNNPTHESGTTCSPEYLKSRLDGLANKVQQTTVSYSTFHNDHNDVLPVVNLLNSTCHRVSDALINGKATSHMASPEDSQHIASACKDVGQAALKYLQGFKEHSEPQQVKTDSDHLEGEIAKILKVTDDLMTKQTESETTDNIVDEEMKATEKVVEDAAARIEEILNKSRKHHSGVQLEVNERILDSCTGLMKAIRELILKSKELQDEIVADGRGSASVKDFYKRHHRWTEGLLSAAKSVGYGATILVDAADKVIERKGKFEELVVASHEIAASTAQLVAASRVKAGKNSKRLPPLMTASKGVGEATAGVVAAVRSGASMTEESKAVPDYSKMTLTQAKRYEMDSQVKILELEDQLQKERQKLGRLRQAHYQIAVELYGEEQVNMD